MDDLLRALERGRARPRRRALGIGAGLAIALLALVVAGGWRAARGRGISCEAPASRLAAVWSGQDDARRQSIHRAFAASGRPNAEATWQRVSRALDDYAGKWSAAYVDTCQATHIRGEQSAEVLDLRMRCLHETLDEVRALTDVFAAGTASTTANATMAVQNLPLLGRCDDIAALRTAIPLPRDARTAQAVRELRAAINDVTALEEVGNVRAAYEKAAALRPRVEALQYRPLLAEFFTAMGTVRCEDDPRQAESLLEEAVVAANASHDDVTAAIAASTLAYTVGYKLARPADGHRWSRLATASLERTGARHDRIRSWILQSDAVIHVAEGRFDDGRRLVEQGLALKESLLGKDHPDVARSLSSLCMIAIEMRTWAEGLRWCNRAFEIVVAIDPDSALLAGPANNRAEVLTGLGRFEEAAADFETALRIMRAQYDPGNQLVAFPLHGLGEAKLAAGQPAAAIPLLEQALSIRERREPQAMLLADTRFSLARALWDGGAPRPRAVELARAAMATYAHEHRAEKERTVATWLAAHKPGRR